ncbi:hypothetical protein COMA2_110031 [Candidatus Nitrospira nitrificans]|uniref:Uncharacterized protein n=1 Tax=Candidatus Nitrospira nitrificans TaxID=1742973 RepID=A0A0S4L9V4_9BACT|nr:hypothetical protein COMA2_110031 [Candidatus Nitrospira nitrificans]
MLHRARLRQTYFLTRHASRMNITIITTAKMIAPKIVTMAISSLIIFVPVLSVRFVTCGSPDLEPSSLGIP